MPLIGPLVMLWALVNVGAAASPVRVIVVPGDRAVEPSEQRLRAIEEAASLSVDSAGEPSSPAVLGERRNQSLASLTLYQTDDQRQSAPASSALGRLTTVGTTVPSSRANEQAWPELKVARQLPSWLNVSSRFKITGASIEQLEAQLPAEMLLRPAFDSPILLKTRLGLLEGVRSIRLNKHLYTFLGVPYARPPIGALRFRAPQPVAGWPGVLQATKWPPFCVQPSMSLASKSSPVHILSQVMSEDCLYLNIWSPSLRGASPSGPPSEGQPKRRPVMVWLHGGAFQYGGISVDENEGSALALAGDVVVVTLNYRISAFGFLNANNPSEAPNNVGLLDQQLALKWVQQNIKQFGGDPQQVTLFGESAGGHSVGLHLISPISQQLFRRAILQSGVPISYLRSYDVNADNKGSSTAEGVGAVLMARRLGCLPALVEAQAEQPTTPSIAGTDTAETSAAMAANTTNTDEIPADEPAGEPETGPQQQSASHLDSAALDCMRQKSSLEILKATGAPGNAGFFPTGNDPHGFFPNGPIMQSFEADKLRLGPQKDFLLGTNTDEGTFMLHYGMPDLFPARDVPRVQSIGALKVALQQQIERMAREATETQVQLAKRNETTKLDLLSASGAQTGSAQAHLYKPLLRMSSLLLESFMAKSASDQQVSGSSNDSLRNEAAEFGRQVGGLISDIIFLCPARSLARTLTESGRNVFMYLYAHRSSRSQYHPWIGVTHHDEVEFVFGRPLRLADVYSGADVSMSQRLIRTWSHFAHTGKLPDQLGIRWPDYNAEDNNYMLLASDRALVGQRYHDRVCNVYDTIISVHLQDT